MNLPLLAAEIVRRVQGSKDSAVNLETVVANLIRSEQSRSPSNLTSCVDPKEVARAHIQAALDDIRDGFYPEAIQELYYSANQLRVYGK